MHISIQKKAIGRSRSLNIVSYDLPSEPRTLKQLLTMLVEIEVTHFNQQDGVVSFLQQQQLDDLSTTGAVKFSTLTPRQEANIKQAQAIMLQAFEDGLFKVLQGKKVYKHLEEEIYWTDEIWTFIKLRFLTGH